MSGACLTSRQENACILQGEAASINKAHPSSFKHISTPAVGSALGAGCDQACSARGSSHRCGEWCALHVRFGMLGGGGGLRKRDECFGVLWFWAPDFNAARAPDPAVLTTALHWPPAKVPACCSAVPPVYAFPSEA